MTTNIDIVIYAWDPRINYEYQGRFIVEGKDKDGQVRAAIGAWITEIISGEGGELQLEDRSGVPAIENPPESLDATTDASAD